jgi:hypothetical protein
MNRKVAIISSLVVICAIAILLFGYLGVRRQWSEFDHLNPGWKSMGHPLIQRLSGLRVIGGIAEGNGFGFLAIGRDGQGPMPIGSLAVGNQEEEVGSGSKATGSIDKKLRAMRFEL